MSSPNPQSTYGENELGTNLEQSGEEMIERLKKVGDILKENPTPMKPSERIEEIVQVMQIDDGLLPGERPLDLFVHAIIEYLDEQASQAK